MRILLLLSLLFLSWISDATVHSQAPAAEPGVVALGEDGFPPPPQP